MSGFNFAYEPVTAERGYGTIAASQTFDAGDPLVWVAGLLDSASVDDTTQLLVADVPAGYALEPASGLRAASRPADSATAALAAGFNGLTQRTYARIDSKVVMNTRNVWAAGAPGTQIVAGLTAALIGPTWQISAVATVPPVTAIWGVENTAGVPATDVCAQIVQILNADGLDIAAFGGTGVSVNFTTRLS